jgi:hypothetical protein
MVADGGHARNCFGGDRDGPARRLGLDKAPEVHGAVRDSHIQLVNTRPRLPFKLLEQFLANLRVGQAGFELGPSACDCLNDVGTANDADEIAGFIQDRNALDVVSSNRSAIS